MRKGIIVELFSSSLYFHLLSYFCFFQGRGNKNEKKKHMVFIDKCCCNWAAGPFVCRYQNVSSSSLVHLRPYFFPNTLYTYSDFWRWQCIWHLLFLWHTSCNTLLFGYAWDLQAASSICVLLKEFHICWPCKLLCTVSCLTCELILIAFCKFL